MNEELIKFIELCLTDGVISDKEREVIFRKAKALGVDEDECEILVDAYTQKVNNKLQQNTNVVSKSNRKFTHKTVKKIKPAPLNQESRLLEEVDTLTEKHQKVSSSYDSVLDDLKATTDEINKIKKEVSNEFYEYKASYDKQIKKIINQYFNEVDKLISKKYGKTEIICTEKEKLSCYNLKKINDFILKDAKWSLERYQKKGFKFRVAFFIFLIFTVIAFFLIPIHDSAKLMIFLMSLTYITYSISAHFYNKKTMNFTDEDVKSVLNKLNKKFQKSFEKLEQQKNYIDKYEKSVKYQLTMSPKKNEILVKQEVEES